MKHIIKKLVLFIAIGIIFTACDNRELETLDANANANLSLSESTLVLSQFDDGQEVLTATWTEPNFGFDSAASYKLLIDIAGGDFSNPKTIAIGSSLTKTFIKESLNSSLNSLDITPNLATDFDFKILTTLSDYSSLLSDAETISITTYPALLDLSTTWGIVGSAANEWGATPDLPFFQTGVNNVYAAYVNLIDGEIKFRESNDWANNYGDDDNDLSLEAGGANIPVTAGSYKIVLDLNNLTYTINLFSWGIVGDAAPNGWDGPDAVLNYDEFSDTFKAVVTLTTGSLKFRLNNDWAINYGKTDSDDGTLESGGGNINVNAGTYNITLDLSDANNPIYIITN